MILAPTLTKFLLIKKQIPVKYFLKIFDIYKSILIKKVLAQVLKFYEVGDFYINLEGKLVGIL